MHSNSAALPHNGRSEQNEQTIERALIAGFIAIVATNVFWVVGGNFLQLSQHILSQLDSALIHLQ